MNDTAKLPRSIRIHTILGSVFLGGAGLQLALIAVGVPPAGHAGRRVPRLLARVGSAHVPHRSRPAPGSGRPRRDRGAVPVQGGRVECGTPRRWTRCHRRRDRLGPAPLTRGDPPPAIHTKRSSGRRDAGARSRTRGYRRPGPGRERGASGRVHRAARRRPPGASSTSPGRRRVSGHSPLGFPRQDRRCSMPLPPTQRWSRRSARAID